MYIGLIQSELTSVHNAVNNCSNYFNREKQYCRYSRVIELVTGLNEQLQKD